MELASAVNDGATLLQWTVALSAASLAGLFDLTTRQIPNQLTLPLLVLGYSVSAALGGLIGFADAAVGSVLLGLPYVLLFALAGGGAGDAKIMAGLGAWLGAANGAVVLFAVSLAGVALALLVLIVWVLTAGRAADSWSFARRKRIPYGVAVGVGAWLAAVGVMQWSW